MTYTEPSDSTASQTAQQQPVTMSRRERRGRKRREKSATFPWPAIVVIAVMVLVAIFGPLFSHYGQFQGDLSTRLAAPFGRDAHGGYHPFGSDDLGRDVATRLMYGARVSLLVGLVGVALACVIGTTVGLLSGILGFIADTALMRLTDIALSIPGLLLAVLIASVFRPSLFTIFCAVGLLLWPTYARLIRAEVLVLKTASFVDMARVAGCPTRTIIVRHLLPNVAPSMMVLATLQVGTAIIIEASISFLGVGLPPNQATWGSMINAGRAYLSTEWWLCVLPGLCIFLAVMSFNALGDWARVRFDPRLKGTR